MGGQSSTWAPNVMVEDGSAMGAPFPMVTVTLLMMNVTEPLPRLSS